MVAGIYKHVSSASWGDELASIGREVQKLASIALNLTSFRGNVELESVFASAFVIDSIPKLPVKTYRLFTLSASSIVDGISRIATAGIVIWIVCLIFIAFGYTSLICEVVNLPSFACSAYRRAFVEVWIPSGTIWTGWDFTNSCDFVEDGFLREALTSVILFVVGMISLATGYASF